MNLKGKKILFFAANFFGYDLAIKEKLESFGAVVYLHDERPSANVFIKAILRLNKNLLTNYCKRYFEVILKKYKDTELDYIFVIKGEVIDKKIIEQYKLHFNNATFILYMWDSIHNYTQIKETLHLYDKAFTFDESDSFKYSKLKFRPLFFLDNFNSQNYNYNSAIKKDQIDILFVGTVHSDRWSFVLKIIEQSKKFNQSFFYYCFVQSPLIYFYKKIFSNQFKNLSLKKVKFCPLSKENIANLIISSNIIIDIQHPKQTGLTMRTIEILGMRKKLITTNKTILNYDFYNENNILIVDRDTPNLSDNFLKSKYEEINPEILNRYTFQVWLREIFEN